MGKVHIYTIDDLYREVVAMRKKGLGKKKIMISADDEGNGYHQLFFGITENPRDLFEGCGAPMTPYGVTEENLDEYVVLG